MPQLADHLRTLEPRIPALCARASAGERLVGVDGSAARRATGLEPEDWKTLHTWFVGSGHRRSDADNVRRLATDAMRSLLTNLRRIAAGADRQQSRYGDLVRLAGWFDAATDERAHELWAATFGLYAARHLAFAADPPGDRVPSTRSWWEAPPAEVPVGLRTHGDRRAGGGPGPGSTTRPPKSARLKERRDQDRRLAAAVGEFLACAGPISRIRVSDAGGPRSSTLWQGPRQPPRLAGGGHHGRAETPGLPEGGSASRSGLSRGRASASPALRASSPSTISRPISKTPPARRHRNRAPQDPCRRSRSGARHDQDPARGARWARGPRRSLRRGGSARGGPRPAEHSAHPC